MNDPLNRPEAEGGVREPDGSWKADADPAENGSAENSPSDSGLAEPGLAEDPQLLLAAEDERLPWLESDEDEDEGTFDLTRLVMVGVIGLLVVLALLSTLWWFTQPRTDGELLAEGSTIEAPEGSFRSRPDDPGGAEVAGTGDMSFEVGEGQSRDSVLAQGDDAPRPQIDLGQAGGTVAAPATAAATGSASTDSQNAAGAAQPVASGTDVGVQVAAFTSSARAEQGWRELSNRFDALQGRRHRVVSASVDGATVYRLQALAENEAAADTLCRALRSAGGDCQVVR